MSYHFSILRTAGANPFGAKHGAVLSLIQEADGFGEVVALLDGENEPLALRIAALLNRNGMEDVPRPMMGEG